MSLIFQQSLNESIRRIETGIPKIHHRPRKIDQLSSCGQLQNAQRADDSQVPRLGLVPSIHVVGDEQIGSKFLSQNDRLSFAESKSRESWIACYG